MPFLTMLARATAGRYITLPMVITRDPKRGIRNVGMYRIQVLGPRHARDALAAPQGGRGALARDGGAGRADAGRHRARRRSRQHLLRRRAPLPPTIDEFLFAGFLRRDAGRAGAARSPATSRCPAEAEFVIEGYIDPAEPLVLEGPFGDHTGFYSLADYYPQVHVTAVTMRRDPIYPATIVGRPPMEDFYLGHATERIFLPLLKLTIPEIVDYHMPAEGIFHNLVFVSIDKQYPGQAYKVMNALWGQGLMSLAKVLVVVDKQVERARTPRRRGGSRSTTSIPSATCASPWGRWTCSITRAAAFTYGSKMGIDATRKWPEEGFTREWPDLIEMDPETTAPGGRDVAAARHPPVTLRPAREGQTFAGESLLVRYVNFVKLPHTLFALPFALLGVLAASRVARRHRRARSCSWSWRSPRALGRDGLQPHRRPRVRRAQSAHPEARAAARRADACGGVALGRARGGAVRLAACCSIRCACCAEPGGARLGALLQPTPSGSPGGRTSCSALSLSIAPVGGYLAVTGRWSEPGGCCSRVARRGRDLGGGLRHLLRAAGRGLRSGPGPPERRGAAGRAARRSCSPSCCTG